MNTIQVSIKADNAIQEILISMLNDFDPLGFEQTDSQLIACFKKLNFNSYQINKTLEGYDFHMETIQEKNWNEIWENNFHPITISGFCTIRADFHKKNNDVPYDIIITPKMSFGTGHHATTYMMIEQLKDSDLREKMILDFGTGTGILAVLAEKIGAKSIIAIDNDEWSINNARENITRNNCSNITLEFTSQLPDGLFDYILANINTNVLIEYLPSLKKRLKKGGRAILSGIMVPDQTKIVEAAQAEGWKLVKHVENNSWICLVFVN